MFSAKWLWCLREVMTTYSWKLFFLSIFAILVLAACTEEKLLSENSEIFRFSNTFVKQLDAGNYKEAWKNVETQGKRDKDSFTNWINAIKSKRRSVGGVGLRSFGDVISYDDHYMVFYGSKNRDGQSVQEIVEISSAGSKLAIVDYRVEII
jgi:hypothetical protein